MREQGELTLSKASREDVEKWLNRGLCKRWYPIAPSWMVQENPLGVTRLSEHLAIWRQSVSAWWHAVKRPGSPTERKAGRVVTHSWVARGHRV